MLLIKSNHSFSEEINSIPGDKSITHRAIILASISKGKCNLKNIAKNEDCLATLNAFHQLGINYKLNGQDLEIIGKGKFFEKNGLDLNLHNSGTSIRLLSGLLSGANVSATLYGDSSLNKRPMKRVILPLSLMGANISSKESTAPLYIKKNNGLKGIEYSPPVASAQVKTCLYLAGMYADGETQIHENIKTRDHFENLLTHIKYPFKNNTIYNSEVESFDINIAKDFSSAIFFIVLTLISKNSSLLLKDININPTRIGAIDILKKMDANISIKNIRTKCNENIADIYISSSKLKAITLDNKKTIASSIDEFCAIFIAAATAEGVSHFFHLDELKVKESNRLLAMANGLKQLGVNIRLTENSLHIEGVERFKDSELIHVYGDHRVAMAFVVASCKAKEILIDEPSAVNVSFPSFWEILSKLGFKTNQTVYPFA